jgi:hypothetical protein
MINIIKLHEAIRKLNPEIVTIANDIAYDIDGNEVAYDKSAAETEANKEQA